MCVYIHIYTHIHTHICCHSGPSTSERSPKQKAPGVLVVLIISLVELLLWQWHVWCLLQAAALAMPKIRAYLRPPLPDKTCTIELSLSLSLYMYLSLSLYIYVYIYIYIYMYMYIHVCIVITYTKGMARRVSVVQGRSGLASSVSAPPRLLLLLVVLLFLVVVLFFVWLSLLLSSLLVVVVVVVLILLLLVVLLCFSLVPRPPAQRDTGLGKQHK